VKILATVLVRLEIEAESLEAAHGILEHEPPPIESHGSTVEWGDYSLRSRPAVEVLRLIEAEAPRVSARKAEWR